MPPLAMSNRNLPKKPKQTNTVLIVKVAVILAITIAIWFIPVPPGVEPRGMHMLAIFAGTILGLIFQPLPTPSVALIGLGAAMITGTMNAKEEALKGFGNDSIWIIVAAFFIADGVPHYRVRKAHRPIVCAHAR